MALFIIKKAMGPLWSPMAFDPIARDLHLWVTFFKIKIKEVKANHILPLLTKIKHIISYLSRG